MKTFTNKKGISYFLLDVPNDATNFILRQSSIQANLGYKIKNKSYIGEELPQGNYELIGLAKDVIEEVAADIVDTDNIYPKAFTCYGNEDSTFFYYATESLSSLVQSLGLNNPIILKLIK